MAADFVRKPAYPIEVKLVPYDGALLKVYCSGAFAVTGSLAGSTTELSVTTRYVASYSYMCVIEGDKTPNEIEADLRNGALAA